MTSHTVLVVSEAFGDKLDAVRTAAAIGRGLQAENPALEAEGCSLEDLPADFDARMHAAHAIVIAAARLDHETLLRRGAAFEVATRARQTGVPCYAVLASNGLDLFEARILDLQVVLEAYDARGLASAGRRLAGLL